jgi:hypothetical protein
VGWVVYAKRPFGSPQLVLKYLARYTHRVAISNSRLLDFHHQQVRFRYKDYAGGNRKRTMTLLAVEFVRRLLLHVLPSRFVRIRHCGLLCNRHRQQKLELCRRLLAPESAADCGSPPAEPTIEPAPVTATRVCPVCGAGRMLLLEELPALTAKRPKSRATAACLVFDSS